VEEEVTRYSSISEPEEVFSPLRTKVPKKTSNLKRNKSCAKFNQLGVPKCMQLAEAIKEGGHKGRRRRQRGGGCVSGAQMGQEGEGPQQASSNVHGGSTEVGSRREEGLPHSSNYVQIPVSGVALISVGEGLGGTEKRSNAIDGERGKLIEAAKLLVIQKEVGFTFEEPEVDTLKQLVDKELNDRAMMMDRENKGFQ
jgi:hypothetical protein